MWIFMKVIFEEKNEVTLYENVEDEKHTFQRKPDEDYTKYLLNLVVHILSKLKNKAALFPRYNNINGICLS